jgi:amino acid permease
MNVEGESKQGLGRFLWVAIFAALSLMHFILWHRNAEVLELVRAVGFALLIPHSWLFPAWPRPTTTTSASRQNVRYVTLALWLVGAAMVVYALARSWL